MIDLGWTATTIPEQYGGLGLGYLELCVIAEELGRAVAPMPFSSSVYLATEAIAACGYRSEKEQWLPRLAAGEVDRHVCARGRTGAAARRRASRPRVEGPPARHEDRRSRRRHRTLRVVVAKSKVGDKASCVSRRPQQRNVKRTAVPTLDPTRSHASITFRERRRGTARRRRRRLGADAEAARPRGDAVCVGAGRRAQAALNMAKNMRWDVMRSVVRSRRSRRSNTSSRHVHQEHAGALELLLRRVGAERQTPPSCRSPPQLRVCQRDARRSTSRRRRTSRRTAAWASRGSSTASSTTAARSCCR